ncbi:Cytochrome P450 94A1 [Glycine soja]|nr:Cytochrome P450 94A1 [Glycine soja]
MIENILLNLQLLAPFFLLFIFPVLLFFFFSSSGSKKKEASITTIPKPYPLIGHYLDLKGIGNRRIQWLSAIVQISPKNPPGRHFHPPPPLGPPPSYHRQPRHQTSSQPRIQHKVSTFVEHVVDVELSDRLVPVLASAAQQDQTLDFQDILQRFAFDNICKIAFGYDAEYLTPSTEQSKFAVAYEEATEISSKRFREPLPLVWKIKRLLNIGSEKRLRIAVKEVRDFAKKIVREKKKELKEKESLEQVDMLSRFLSSGHSDEDFVTDIVISFILAGKDTTSAALMWFFWLLSKNPGVEKEVLKEIMEKPETPAYDEVKDMVYIHAALCESMRLYPPVSMDSKEAVDDDVLPDGTVVKKGTLVTYHVYAMGRMESIWGEDWAEFKPERWLEKVETGKWKFVGRDSFTYPVFQAGPRICLGKEMAFMQMKRLVAGILRRFTVVPAMAKGVEPHYFAFLTSQMEGGFPVKIIDREASC